MRTVLRRFKRDDCSRTAQRLSSYIDRRLNPPELHQVELHLTACRGCQKKLEALQTTVDLLHRLPQASPSRSFRIARPEPSRRWTPLPVLRLATAAAAILLILAFTADLVNLFDTSLSPVGEKNDTYSYTDNRSAALGEEDNQTGFAGLPNDGQELSPTSDGALESTEAGWVRPLEYGLAGLVVVLGGVTAWLWLKPKRRTKHLPA